MGPPAFATMVENPAPAPSASDPALRSREGGAWPPCAAARRRRHSSPAPLTSSNAPITRAASDLSTWSITAKPAASPTATAGSIRTRTRTSTARP